MLQGVSKTESISSGEGRAARFSIPNLRFPSGPGVRRGLKAESHAEAQPEALTEARQGLLRSARAIQVAARLARDGGAERLPESA